MSCKDRKISLKVGHFGKVKQDTSELLFEVEPNQKYIQIMKILKNTPTFFKYQFCFCSHFSNFSMVEDNVP